MQSSPDIEHASRKLANLSVSQRSPLEEIYNKDEEKTSLKYSSHSSCSDQPSFNKSVKTSGSESEHDQEDKIRFNKLVKKAKYLAQDGHIAKALELNRQALAIHYHEKLARRIAKMEEYLRNYGENEEQEHDDQMIEVGSGFYLYKDLHSRLYSHQKEGVLWLWGLHQKNKGGILGDDMGLGKTIQIIAFLSGLFDMGKIKHALIVVPVSVMITWEKEFSKWAPGISVHAFHGNSKRERERALERVRSRGGVLVTTYGMVVTSWENLASKDGRDFLWDYVILDEGHKIKNPTKTTKGINAVGAKHRIILTGTPIQNNLKELWTLFDYVHQGALLGTLRTFKMEFENPIIRARERDATGGEKKLGMEMANILKKIINPYFLRRTKAQVSKKEKDVRNDDSSKKAVRMPSLTYKNDFVVWLFLSDTQVKIYQDFLELDSVKELLMSAKSPLVALTVLKKICDHPRLLSLRACYQLGLHGHSIDEDELELPSSLESAVTKIEELSDPVLVGEAGKMGVLISLLDQLKSEGHRTLVFSQSRRMLDIIQKVLRNRGHKVMRLDGTITHISERASRVQKFQEDKSYSVFLLTTQVGGVGLTLTAADRVVIYDPSWNPATDAQAVDRVFRIGQTRNVVVYRLITCGTVEEKIYRRQIFKDSITRQTTGNAQNPYRYFTKQELRELFQLGDTHSSSTQQQLEEMHGEDRRRDPELDEHIAFLYSLNIFGISDHDLMFSQELSHDEEFEDGVMSTMDPHNQEYIQHRVRKAQEIIERESSMPGTIEQRMAAGFPTISSIATSQHHEVSKLPATSQPNLKNAGQSTLNRPVPAASMVQTFIPKPSDTQRSMMNRIPEKQGNPDPVRAEVKKEPLEPKVPLKTAVENHSSIPAAHNYLSDNNDDVVEVPVVTVPPTVIDLTESDEESSTTELPKKTEPKGRQIETTDAPEGRQIETTDASEGRQIETTDAPDQLAAMQNLTLEDKISSTKQDARITPSPPMSHKHLTSGAQQSITPRRSHQRIVEEELIISPTAYTPLMETRRKRRRMSPASNSEPEDLHSSPVCRLGDLSPDKIIATHRRRSVCRSMARIESSEEEEENEEDKENIHPAYSSLVQKSADLRDNEQDDNEEEQDSVAEEDLEDVNDGEGDDEEAVEDSDPDNRDNEQDDNEEEQDCEAEEDVEDVNEGEDEEEEAVEDTDPDDGGKEADASVEVFDESVVESQSEEDENVGAEDEGGDDEPIDIERLQRLLKKGNLLYKQQLYSEAYQYVLEALDIVDDPQLQALAEKIHSKINPAL